MVRRMVGVLVEVGCRRMPEKDVPTLLHTSSEVPLRHMAPAAGLFFEKAFYDANELGLFLAENLQTE